jgi:hypothetical protein
MWCMAQMCLSLKASFILHTHATSVQCSRVSLMYVVNLCIGNTQTICFMMGTPMHKTKQNFKIEW